MEVKQFDHEDVSRKTKLLLALHGQTSYKTGEYAKYKAAEEAAAAAANMDLGCLADPLKLWELKVELDKTSNFFFDAIMKKYPELKSGLEKLSYKQIKELRQVGRSASLEEEKVDYVSVINGRKNTYLYAQGSLRGTAEDPCENMTLEEAIVRLKSHRDALFAEWRRPVPEFIISKQSMFELNWYPSSEMSVWEQFEEYKKLFITPERQKRETPDNELRWDIEWISDKYSIRKRHRSTVMWRTKNVFGPKRMQKKLRKTRVFSYFTAQEINYFFAADPLPSWTEN